MITSGLQIIYTKDEVAFVQNLVYYIERAYRTPDYAVWERGSSYNDNTPEIHARFELWTSLNNMILLYRKNNVCNVCDKAREEVPSVVKTNTKIRLMTKPLGVLFKSFFDSRPFSFFFYDDSDYIYILLVIQYSILIK